MPLPTAILNITHFNIRMNDANTFFVAYYFDVWQQLSVLHGILLGVDGDTRDDFRIECKGSSIHVLNAPSPAATACLAIGDTICEMASQRFNLG